MLNSGHRVKPDARILILLTESNKIINPQNNTTR